MRKDEAKKLQKLEALYNIKKDICEDLYNDEDYMVVSSTGKWVALYKTLGMLNIEPDFAYKHLVEYNIEKLNKYKQLDYITNEINSLTKNE